MYTVILILIIIVCIALGFVVLIQNSKGGGLAANFSAPTQVMGVRQTADVVEKATWWLAVALGVLCLLAAITIPSRQGRNALESEVTTTATAVPSPVAPAASTATMPVAE